MEITYIENKMINKDQLEALFLSVNWESGKYPQKIVDACKNASAAFSAWDNEKLVGLCTSITDNVFFVFIPWLLVMPEYQKQGIGKKLFELVREKYKTIPRIVLNSYTVQTEFYKKCGFAVHDEVVPMILKQ